jgi:predicted ATPase/transcriptional regulator with XRE-family HTH domain
MTGETADFAALLRQLRTRAGLTQEELAAAAQVGVNTVADLEQRRHQRTHKPTAERLADALGMRGHVRDLFVAAARGQASAAEVLAAATGEQRPTNLPVQLATFIGRDLELSEVRDLVASSRLVTLTGAGGCGKTRLGLRAAAELLGGCADGAWLVELAAVADGDGVAPAIATALGIARHPGRPVLDALLDALAPQQMLIVLDNCEHLTGACAKTADALLRRCPRVRLLATSREPLGIGGETIYQVPPLSLPRPGDTGLLAAGSSDAVALFADRAHAHAAGLVIDEQTAPLVVSICARLDGLPLAIELAAARLRSLSLAALHDRLDQRFHLLTGGSRTAAARQQTLQATVEWSHALLHASEQALLRRLAVFAGSFDLDAVEAVCGFGDIEVFDVAGLLGSLVDKSLVIAEPAGPDLRYRLLETIRQFAAWQLAEAGEMEAGETEASETEASAVAAAHGRHFLAVAETAAPHLAGPDQGEWLARLDADAANLRRAASHAAGDPRGTAQVLRFGVALKRYWLTPERYQEAFALLMPVLDRPEARNDPELLGAALVTAASAASLADTSIARQLGEQAVELARRLGAERLLVDSLVTLGNFCYRVGEEQRGFPLVVEAVERARRLGDDGLLGDSLRAYLHFSAFIDSAQAQSLLSEALACTQRSGDHAGARFLLNNAGLDALEAGDIPAARAYLQQAQALQPSGNQQAHLALNLGWILRQDDDLLGARSNFTAALRAGRRNANLVHVAFASLGLACLAADAGDWHRAAGLHGVAQAFLDQAALPWVDLEARCREESVHLVRAHLGKEQFERAHAEGMMLSFDEAIDLASVDSAPVDSDPGAGSSMGR